MKQLVDNLDVSRETMNQLETYHGLLLKWQKAKNLIAPSTISDAGTRHFLDSAQLSPILSDMAITGPILDIGSGAGFPGMVLSIMGHGPVHLVESNGKKASFLSTVIRETAANATVHNCRIEALKPFLVGCITARACATIAQLLNWGIPFIGKNTKMLLLKGSKWQEELTEAQERWTMQSETRQSVTDPTGRIVLLSDIVRKSP